ncbi:MAG TPA: hypothetical protein VKS60_24990 [Stellaceae bacterium]|nr:hypothetical protein [Stellaceae bacterium]
MTARHLWRVLLVGAVLLGAPRAGIADDQASSLAAWQRLLPVLEHPRCLNCHQANVPLQGDERRIHLPRVERGPDGMGDSAMRCTACHSQAANNPSSGAPGAEGWSLAPETMVWQGLSSGDLCRLMKDKARNGNRTPEQIVEHVDKAPLVRWGWAPGGSRSTPPLGHAEFVQQMKLWAAGGAACPQ